MSQVKEETLPLELQELKQAIEAQPLKDSRLIGALEGCIRANSRKRRILKLVQDALSQLRLDMKYLMFDLEATRRERDELKERLNG
ncbi:MAG: transcriptional regulator [Planctomycetota bacterium]|jgi:hypothetical protein